MDGMESARAGFTQVMDLGMAVMTGGYTVISTGILNLLKFKTTVLAAGFFKSGLKKTASAKHIDTSAVFSIMQDVFR